MATHPRTMAPPSTPQDDRRAQIPAWAEILIVCATFLVVKQMPGLPTPGSLGIAASALVATILIYRRGESWTGHGFRWAKSPKDYLKGVGMVVAVFAGATATNAVMMPLLDLLLGAEAAQRAFPDVSTFQRYLMLMGIVWTTAAFCEEMVCRAFLMSRFANVFGNGRIAWILAALGQAVLFGLAHAYQGIGGILITGAVGFTFGLLYLVAKRNLWPLIIGHGLINTFGITALHLQATGALSLS